MKQFLSFVKKEFFHIFRDRWTMIILFLLPVMMLILFGFAITNEVKNAKIGIYDPSKDAMTRAIIDKLDINEYFEVARYLDSPDEVEKIFQKGEISLIVMFSSNFYENAMHSGEARVMLMADGSDPNTATTLIGYATSIINAYKQEIIHGEQSFKINSDVKFLYNPQMKGAYNFVPGVMGLVLMLICSMMTSVAIAREKETGTMEILLVSPVKTTHIILSKAVPYFVLSVVNLITILVTSVFLLKVPIAGSLLLLTGVSLIYIFLSLAIGLFISSIVSTQLAALLISAMGLMIPVILLSGMMFPVESMPLFLRMLSDLLPAKWYIMAIKKIMIKGVTFPFVIKETLILSGMTIFLFLMSLKKFKNRLE